MQIEILDSIECQLSKADGKILFPCLSFESVYWVQGPHKKTPKKYTKNVFSFQGKTHWRFYTGLLPRVKQWCKTNNIPLEIIGEEIKLKPQSEPQLLGVTFRPDQLKLIDAACRYCRGVIQAPTGVGKTIIQLGVLSCYPKARALILAHTTSIVDQTFRELGKFGFKSSEMFGGGIEIAKPTKQITVSTMQSFIKLDPKHYLDYYDLILIDEAHHVQGIDSTYKIILSQTLAPIRLGFTATVRTNPEAVLVSEGLLGPVIGKTTITEAAELNILAKPKIKFIKAKCSMDILDLRKYQDVYNFGIIENPLRNRQIAKIVEEFYQGGRSILIFVTQIHHGELIADEIYKHLNIKVPFVQGEMPQPERSKIQKALIQKKLKICIATTSWMEGVNIQNLDVVILTSAGKSEIQTLQRIGRGLRKTDDKDNVIIVDFLDLSHFHLIRQLGERLAIYSDAGWL